MSNHLTNPTLVTSSSSIRSDSVISNLVNSSYFVNFVHHSTSTDLASIGYDDALVQEFSQVAGVELKLTEAIPRLAPSILKPPTLELKPLPENLKYAFLAPNEKLPIIIVKDLQLE